MNKSQKASEHKPIDGLAKVYSLITFGLSVFFLIQSFSDNSFLYFFLFLISAICFAGLFNALFMNQRIVIDGNKITLLYRTKPPLSGKVASTLDQVVMKKGRMTHFRFIFSNGHQAQISPFAYERGEELQTKLETILAKEKATFKVVER